MLKLENIQKTFKGPKGEVRALAPVSLQAEAGEFLAVRGASGAGKTTLLLIAAGLLRPDAGSVLFNDQPVYVLNAARRAALRSRHFGFVFQQYHLVPYLDITANIMLPLTARKIEKPAELAAERI